MQIVIKKRGAGKVVKTIDAVTEFEILGNKNGDVELEIIGCDEIKNNSRIIMVNHNEFIQIKEEI